MADRKIKESVLAFDADGDGMLTEGEVLLVVQSMGAAITTEQGNQIIDTLGTKGQLVKPDLAFKCVKDFISGKDLKADLMAQFKRFDRGGNGTIAAKELVEILHTIGGLLSEGEQQALCDLAAQGENIPYKDLVDALCS